MSAIALSLLTDAADLPFPPAMVFVYFIHGEVFECYGFAFRRKLLAHALAVPPVRVALTQPFSVRLFPDGHD